MINDIIDKIYIINLDSRKDRWETITNHLNDINISNYERISATKVDINCDISTTKLAQISCFHSHLKTLRKAYQLKLNNVLILEDDCKFINIDNLKYITNEFDILYLGCNRKIYRNENRDIYLSNIEKINDYIVKISECGTAHAILYSKNFIDKIIEMYPNDVAFFEKSFTLEERYSIYDIFLNWFTEINKIQKYSMCPIVCSQYESFSDIEFYYANYDEQIKQSWL